MSWRKVPEENRQNEAKQSRSAFPIDLVRQRNKRAVIFRILSLHFCFCGSSEYFYGIAVKELLASKADLSIVKLTIVNESYHCNA